MCVYIRACIHLLLNWILIDLNESHTNVDLHWILSFQQHIWIDRVRAQHPLPESHCVSGPVLCWEGYKTICGILINSRSVSETIMRWWWRHYGIIYVLVRQWMGNWRNADDLISQISMAIGSMSKWIFVFGLVWISDKSWNEIIKIWKINRSIEI